jgi:hypothetical protein
MASWRSKPIQIFVRPPFGFLIRRIRRVPMPIAILNLFGGPRVPFIRIWNQGAVVRKKVLVGCEQSLKARQGPADQRGPKIFRARLARPLPKWDKNVHCRARRQAVTFFRAGFGNGWKCGRIRIGMDVIVAI